MGATSAHIPTYHFKTHSGEKVNIISGEQHQHIISGEQLFNEHFSHHKTHKFLAGKHHIRGATSAHQHITMYHLKMHSGEKVNIISREQHQHIRKELGTA